MDAHSSSKKERKQGSKKATPSMVSHRNFAASYNGIPHITEAPSLVAIIAGLSGVIQAAREGGGGRSVIVWLTTVACDA